DYGEGSDTWSANPLCCAAVLATLDEFAARDVLGPCRRSSAVVEAGGLRLEEPAVVGGGRRGERGLGWGGGARRHPAPPAAPRAHAGRGAAEWANACVLACYRGDGGDGIHLLGPLAKKVLRIAPPLVITEPEARDALALMYRLLAPLAEASPGQTHGLRPVGVE